MNYYSIYESFGSYNQQYNPQPAEEWDNLHSSTKQNSSALWAETEEELAEKWENYWGEEAQW